VPRRLLTAARLGPVTTRVGIVVMAAIVVVACAGQPGAAGPTSAASSAPGPALSTVSSGHTCRPTEPVPPNNELQTITYAGMPRTYVLSVPPAYDGSQAAPLVFDFYGRVGEAQEQVADFQFDDQAIAAGMLVVTPQASPDRDPAKNAWAGDTDLVPAILKSLEQRWCVDRNAVFVTGFSDGGVFSAYVACALPGVFAAMGSVAELGFPADCPTAAQFSLVGFHGRSDPLVPFDGGATDADDGRNGLPGVPDQLPPSQPITATFTEFAEHLGCAPEPARAPVLPGVDHLTFPGCPSGRAVELFVIDDGGHEWPGDPAPDQAAGPLDANHVMLQFFLDHRRR